MKNNKVPIAILSSFLIAFILQGVLKLSGILVFEKVLDWEIFDLIDKYSTLKLIFCSLFNVLTIYCMSFAFSNKAYSKKWFHYVIILIVATSITYYRMFYTYTQEVNIFLDIFMYVIVPFAINITIDKNNRLFSKINVFSVVTTLSLNIFMYLSYLGLNYWSILLNSFFIVEPTWFISSRIFLIQLEVYIGLISIMLSMNMLINYIKENRNMVMPLNIASDEAKKQELENKKAKKQNKKNAK